MKPDQMIRTQWTSLRIVIRAAERWDLVRHQEYFISQHITTKKWERLARNIERDTIAIAEAEKLLARLA